MVYRAKMFVIGILAPLAAIAVVLADIGFAVPVLASVTYMGWWSIGPVFLMRMGVAAMVLLPLHLPKSIDPQAGQERLAKSRFRIVLKWGAGWVAVVAGLFIGPVTSHAILRTGKYPPKRMWLYAAGINAGIAAFMTGFYLVLYESGKQLLKAAFGLGAVLLVFAASSGAAHAEKAPQARVLLISLDGFDARLMPYMPSLVTLSAAGSSTLRAEAPMPAVTVVSHAAMLTGAGPKVNGVGGEDYPRDPDEQAAWRPLKSATISMALKRARLKSAAFVQKPKMLGLLPAEAVGHAMLSTVDGKLVDNACQLLEDPDGDEAFVFVHLKILDMVGHHDGWLSRPQIEAAGIADGYVRELHACNMQSGVRAVTIVTSDHGGHGKTHGTAEDRYVPWIAIGNGIRYDHKVEGVRLIDTAPTILHLLGLDPKKALPRAEGRVLTDILVQ